MTFEYHWSLVPPRYWLKWWHWTHWSVTIFRGQRGQRVGTWQLNAGPLVITRLVRI